MIEGQEGVTLARVGGARARLRGARHPGPVPLRPPPQPRPASTSAGSLDAWAVINALAACTTSLHLGTLVSPVTFRHPSEVAKLVVAADHVSGGRV